MKAPEATTALLNAINDLEPGNRNLAVAGLLRNEQRMAATLQAIQQGKVDSKIFNTEQIASLKSAPSDKLRDQAAAIFK
jgi:hypothetical protein